MINAKDVLVIVSLWVLFNNASGQKVETIYFTPVDNFEVYTARPGLELSDISLFKGIPSMMDMKIYLLNFQDLQSFHTSYRKGYYSEKYYFDAIKNNPSLYEHLYDGKDIINSIPILSALLPDNMKIIIPDTNFNNDFSDDKVYEYKITDYDTRYPIDSIPTVEVEYDYCLNGKIYKKIAKVKILPSTDSYHDFKNIRDKELFVVPMFDERKSTITSIDNKNYELTILHPNDVQANYKNCTIFVKDIYLNKKIRFSPILKESAYFKLDSNRISINNVSYFGDSAIITYEKYNQISRGISEGNVLPDSTQNILKDIVSKQTGYTLIDFWGSWCEPCIKALPELKFINDKYMDNSKFELMSVAYELPGDSLKLDSLVQRYKITWQNVIEYQISKSSIKDRGKLVKYFSIDFYPTTMLINSEGEVLFRGFGTDSIPQLKSLLENIFGY